MDGRVKPGNDDVEGEKSKIDAEALFRADHDVEALHRLTGRALAEIVEKRNSPRLLCRLIAKDKKLEVVGTVQRLRFKLCHRGAFLKRGDGHKTLPFIGTRQPLIQLRNAGRAG